MQRFAPANGYFMFRHLLHLFLFLIGLLAVCWIGAGYVHSNPLGTAVAGLIGACYLAGALELFRYRQATASLQRAVSGLSTPPERLADWLQQLDPGLRHPVRLRIEGERVALPAPTLTPYLVGLLVLLGMLGTLLGMMATLKGTGMALGGGADLQALRGSLAAPVKGLGFAFGTSIAGVASSAMLGLLSALSRAERLRQVQLLDLRIAGPLRAYSQAHRRDESFRLQQQQSETLPALVDRLQAMMTAIEAQQLAASERQRTSQDAFHAATETVYTRLAQSVHDTLRSSVVESARAAGAALEPVMTSAMAALGRETTALHDTVSQATQRQLDSLASGFAQHTAAVAGHWNDALAQQRQANQAVTQALDASLARFATTFEQRSAQLLEGMASRIDAAVAEAARGWGDALAQQQATNASLVERQQQALLAVGAGFETQAASLVSAVSQSHEALQATLEQRDDERLAAWGASLEAIAARASQQWERTGEQLSARQQAVCDALAHSAEAISASTRSHASETIAEMSRLVEAASEAPRAAAEVGAEMRQKLSDSMVRDTAMLEERSHLLGTLETLLDAVNHASTEQRSAVDALVSTSAELLERIGSRFNDQVDAQAERLGAMSAQVAAGAAEVASLGEAFGAGVASFGQSNDALMERLQQIAAALDASLARSDEQLAYYVAQAKEVIDLSMASQQQIVEDLRRVANDRSERGAEAA